MPSLSVDELVQLAGTRLTRTASDGDTSWRSIVADVNEAGLVIVTKHDEPEAVVLSVEQFAELTKRAAVADALTELRTKWDGELAWLNEPAASQELMEIFRSTPEEIAASANAVAARRGK
ncbi:MAG: type II toxin-antitoxin system prevent-host-death family antitoxin [Acidobacteria bacterium]|nr:type II toxin-antitoxin system prevent-host-death family antitoxin [Acidobacteriota bacterium]MBV9474905.1 type II toxin-antitoxin system prevent-host-death family antitoxin [Acidobacteriota bacterium]